VGVRVVLRPNQDVDVCLGDGTAGVVYLDEGDMRLAKDKQELRLASLHKYTQSLVMVQANSRQPNPTFDKLQLRIATRYGFTVLPVLNEAEAAKVLGKMVSGRLRSKPLSSGGISKPVRQEPLDLLRVLMSIPGVGEQKAKALLGDYKTLQALANAGPEELGQVASIGATLGQSIYDFFHNSFDSGME